MSIYSAFFAGITKGAEWYEAFVNSFLPRLDADMAALLGQAATSTSSLSIGTGSKTFALTPADREFPVDALLRARRASDAAVYMVGLATAASAGSVTIDSVSVGGAGGPYTDWIVTVDVTAIVPDATTAVEGVVELATVPEGVAGTSATLAMTPATSLPLVHSSIRAF